MNKRILPYCLVSFILCSLSTILHAQRYSTIDGKVSFTSDAPLEVIKAASNELQGVIDLSQKRFAFKLNTKSFEGFNNPLQKVHFQENFLDTESYPFAQFEGKVLEEIVSGKGNYRAKGTLTIHGVSKETIIPIKLVVTTASISFNASFDVKLEDYQIDLPLIVYQKIAELININVSGLLQLRK